MADRRICVGNEVLSQRGEKAMSDDKTFQVTGTMADYVIQKITEEGEEWAIGYLKAGFLAAAVDALFYARRQAGLTEAEVAARLKLKPAAVTRLEGDVD